MNRRDLLKTTVGFATASALAAEPSQTRWLQEVPGHDSSPAPDRGPLRVLLENPRYFTDGSGKAVFLTGSHTWADFQDIGAPPIARLSYPAYLEMMIKHNHNFMRFWHWLQPAYAPWTKDKILFEPLLYVRTAPGTAKDGLPKFDLTKFNQVYFERMNSRITEACDHMAERRTDRR